MNNRLYKLIVSENASIKQAMRSIDAGTLGIAFLIDKQSRLAGVITDGDIRRSIIKGIDISKPVKQIANFDPIFIKAGILNKNINRVIPLAVSLCIPVLDKNHKVTNASLLYTNNKKVPVITPVFKQTKLKQRNVKNVLITGGAGYLGSVLSRKLIKNGYRVTVLDSLLYGDHGIKDLLKHKNFALQKGDVRNIEDISKAIHGADAVIHLAAVVGDPASAVNSKLTIETNFLSSTTLAQACKFNQINRFLFISTCSVYGSKPSSKKIKEVDDLNPVSLYAQTKIESEKGILSLLDDNFLPTIFRFSTLFGVSPRMRFDLAINLFAAQSAVGKTIEIFGGDQYRPFLSVDDAANACMTWLKTPLSKVGGEIINVGFNPQNIKIKKIGDIISKLSPKTEISIRPDLADKRDYNVSFDKMSKLLKLRPAKTIETSVGEMITLVKSSLPIDINSPEFNNHQHFLKNFS